MLKKKFMHVKVCFVLIIISFVFCSCSSNNDLPKGVDYFEPIWFENLSEYATGNSNYISEFKDGFAVATFSNMGEEWKVSGKSVAVINKKGEIVLGPFHEDVYINIIDKNNFCILSDGVSKIVDADNNTKAVFDGTIEWSLSVSSTEHLFNKDGIASCAKTDSAQLVGFGLVNQFGEVVAPYKYKRNLSDVEDEYIVLIKDEERKNADVYNSDGSFSHSISSDYMIQDYKNGLLEIVGAEQTNFGYYQAYGYGFTDIYGNVVVEPVRDSECSVISKDCIIISDRDNNGCQLLNSNGEIIKNLNINFYNATEMVNDVFMLSSGYNSYLINSKGELLKEYDGSRYPEYCGDGIFSLTFGSYNDEHVKLIDSKTGDFIGEQYGDRMEICFNDGYAFVEDPEYNSSFVIDKKGNKCIEGYEISGDVTDRVVRIHNDTTAGIICLPPIEE